LLSMTKPSTKERAFKGVAVRTDESNLESRLDRVAEILTQRAAGVPQRRTTVAKVCMERGLEAMERELGLS
jgi:hypothetical protein